MTQFFVQWGHLLSAMIVFAGLWTYAWSLDCKLNRLRQEISEAAESQEP